MVRMFINPSFLKPGRIRTQRHEMCCGSNPRIPRKGTVWQMRFLRNIRVGSRLAIGFGFLAVIIIAFGSFAVSRLGVTTTALERMDSQRVTKLELLFQIEQLTHQTSRAMVQFWSEVDPVKRARWEKFMDDSPGKYYEIFQQIRDLVDTPEEKAQVAVIDGWSGAFWGARGSMRELRKAFGPVGTAIDYVTNVNIIQNTLDKSVIAYRQWQVEQAHLSAKAGVAFFHQTRNVAIIGVLLAILLAAGTGFVITRSITQPL